MRLIFMGSPDFSVPILDALHAAGHDIAAVYCQPPRPAGRGKKDRPTAVHARAEALGLTVHHPISLKTPEALETFQSHTADIAVVVAYGLILPQSILDAPTQGCLNIHASLLPRWRGAAPIHRAIMAGDIDTGICIMQMEAGLDTGPVLTRHTTPIGPTETTGELHDRLAALGASAITQALNTLPTLTPKPQPDTGVTYAHKIDKSEARIDWTKPAAEVSAHIRGLAPFPGAWCEMDGDRLKLLGAETTDATGTPGEILAPLTVACGTGAVKITKLQRPGKQAMDTDTALRGITLPRHLT